MNYRHRTPKEQAFVDGSVAAAHRSYARTRNHHRHSNRYFQDWRATVLLCAITSIVGLIAVSGILISQEVGWKKEAPLVVTPQPDPNFVKNYLSEGRTAYTNVTGWPYFGGFPKKLPPDVTVQGDTFSSGVEGHAWQTDVKSRRNAEIHPVRKRGSRNQVRPAESFFGTQDIRGSEAYKVALENSETLEK
jgi:hypothetical protein